MKIKTDFNYLTILTSKSYLGILLCFLLPAAFTHAQEQTKLPYKISGKVIDSASSLPIEYATLNLINERNNKLVNGTVTDAEGNFFLEADTGKYDLVIYFIGYRKITLEHITVSESRPAVMLENIKLASSLKNLKEVTVTTERSLIENKIDKMVYNAGNDLTSQSGTAADVLKKVPQVSVDENGNVELQGSSGIKFLINGKPSTLFGSNITEVLQNIPASLIQSIEVITSPGAKYDAEGTGGIINIILKKSTSEGFNGNVSLSAGTRLENGSLNLNFRKSHVSANVYCSGNAQLLSQTLNRNIRTSYDSTGQATDLIQEGTSGYRRDGLEGGAGFDWEINDKNDLSVSVGIDHSSNKNEGMNSRSTVSKDLSGNTVSGFNDRVLTSDSYREDAINWEVNYKRTFEKEDQELNIAYYGMTEDNYTAYSQSQQATGSDSTYDGSYGKDPGTERENEMLLDYTQPLGENALLETGAKATFTNVSSTSDIYVLNPASGEYSYSTGQSSKLIYKANVYAAYLSGSVKLSEHLNAKAGIRYEYTTPEAYFSNAGITHIKPPYSTWVPSGAVSYSFKTNNTVKVSYTHRIERPDDHDLNPFLDASDPKNLSTGNPGLRPETGDKVELGFSKIFEKGPSITATLFYRGNRNDIQSFTRFYESFQVNDSIYHDVSVTTIENIGRENNFGLSIFALVPIKSKLNFRTNISGFQRYIINGALPGRNIQGFNYRINMNLSYEVSKTFAFEFFGNFNSARINAQGKMPSFTSYTLALRKKLLKDRLSIAVSATNPFNKYVNQKTELTGDNFSSVNIRQLPYRSFGINITYRFGKLEFKAEDEMQDPNLTPPQ